MQSRTTPVIQVAAILTALFAGGFPGSAGAQGLTPERFSGIDVRSSAQLREQANQFLPAATAAAFHQKVPVTRLQPQRRSKPYSRAQHVTATIVMGFAGFWIGGKAGATLEGQCGCDDPGLKGFMIGAPIGAVAGTALGFLMTR